MDDDLEVTRRGFPAPVLIAGAVAGLVGFVVAIEQSSWSSVDGEIVDATYRNWGALVGGVVAIGLAGIAAATRSSIRVRSRTAHLIGAIAVLGLGGVQVARGLGAFWSPPGGDRAARSGAPSDDWMDDMVRSAMATPADAATATATDAATATARPVDAAGEDPKARRAALARACDGGDATACADLAYYAARGLGGAIDGALALDSARKGCEGGVALGCRNVAAVLDEQLADPPVQERRELLEAACASYAERGCEMLADELLGDDDGASLSERGRAALRLAAQRLCQIANPRACKLLALAAERGWGGPAEPSLVARARRRGCALGNAEACDEGEVPGAARTVRFISMDASDGGDHLDRIEAMERAFAPCAEGLTRDVHFDGELEIDAEGAVHFVRIHGGSEARRTCMLGKLPFEVIPVVAADAVVVRYQLDLGPA